MDDSALNEVAARVSHYFRDFLESDFKRQQMPRRRIVLQSDQGFRTGMKLRTYPSLDAEFWALVGRPGADAQPLKLAPRRHTRALSPTLRKIIDEQVASLAPEQIAAVHRTVVAAVADTYIRSIDDPESWVDGVVEKLCEAVGHDIVRPLITRLDGPLKRSAYSVIDSLYSAEAEMIAAVAAPTKEALPGVLARHLARRDDEAVAQALGTFLTLEGSVAALQSFFESFVAADAFLEFRDLETFVSITDSVQLYLYIGSCTYLGVQYPLFFAPVEVDKQADGNGYALSVVPQLFANRAAIDFVLQELATGNQREWASPIKERINYVAPEQSLYEVARGLFRLAANAMDLAGQIELGSEQADASTAQVALSSGLHLCAFERGEEALVNDYEALITMARQGGSAVVDLFGSMVRGILTENPRSIGPQVEQAWDALPLADRLVFDSPIPLNEEQRKILLAIRHPEGRIVVVEGPPGTGKSHTITAIAADCAFTKRSCLVLSDKTEALQVVQDKLSEAMSRVRHDRAFPNPLLRIGRQDANFKRLVANQTVQQIAAYVKAEKANQPQIEAEKRETSASLKQAIDQTAQTLGKLTLQQIAHLHRTEEQLRSRMPELIPVLQQLGDPSLIVTLRGIVNEAVDVERYLTTVFAEADHDTASLWLRVRADDAIAQLAREIGGPDPFAGWSVFDRLDTEQLRTLMGTVVEYRQLKMPLFGYLFRGAATRALERRLNELPASRPLLLRADIELLHRISTGAGKLRQVLDARKLADALGGCYERIANRTVDHVGAAATLRAMTELSRIPNLLDTLLAREKDEADLWTLAITYMADWIEVGHVFARAPQFDYVGTKSRLERLNTSVMNTNIDSRLVEFVENNRGDARTLAALMQQRQKFPEDKFEAMRLSFPVIIASIREFGEYMPLVPDLFDVVVIDEASQVSVAQALPALLRGKKIVVLGDSRQFSNVKSSNASIAINDKYRADLVQFYRRNVRDDAEALQRLSMFDVKRSVLEFCSMAASYTIMLRKHFRSYPELISYSSATFYDHQLQALKVRGVPIREVIRFTRIEAGDKRATRTVNEAEGDFILAQLIEMLDEMESPPTVGIITPFRDQQTWLTRFLFGHARSRDFETRLRLKIMTFDSCQGEERQVIFYSMVATDGKDALNYVFPVDLQDATQAVEEKLKVQRLNVGFSRAQETIWFVHSMPIDSFRGSIGKAMNHYRQVLDRRDVRADQTDASSPMEAKVLAWLQATQFVQAQADEIEIQPQFPIGDYLRQLDPTYEHPAWRVDFLMTVPTARGPLHVVIEYDGFEYHFEKGREVHVGNHERYLLPADVERQLTLESYGYRFLRINRFNLGQDPVATLDERLNKLLAMALGEQASKVVERLREQAAGIARKEMKPCSRCGEIRARAEFFDPHLGGGAGAIGRVCMPCKRLT